MSESKHEEGWKAEPTGRNDRIWEVRSGDRTLMAETNPTGLAFSATEAEGMARLFAASLDLKEAARFALSVLKANPIEMSERMAIEKLEASIARAEGR